VLIQRRDQDEVIKMSEEENPYDLLKNIREISIEELWKRHDKLHELWKRLKK